MGKGLTRAQYKVIDGEHLRHSFGSTIDVTILDPKLVCELMAEEAFDLDRCAAYSRSGSFTCTKCPCRYPLQSTKEIIWTPRGVKMANEGTCTKCKQYKTIIAKQQCHRCLYGSWKDLSAGDVARILEAGGGGKRGPGKKQSVKQIPTRESLGVRTGGTGDPGDEIPIHTPPQQKRNVSLADLTEHGILLDFSKDTDLFTRILESAKRNRRPAGQEVLYLLEKALQRGMDGTSVSVPAVVKVLAKIKNYPIPEGSPKQVYDKTVDVAILRVQEMVEVE